MEQATGALHPSATHLPRGHSDSSAPLTEQISRVTPPSFSRICVARSKRNQPLHDEKVTGPKLSLLEISGIGTAVPTHSIHQEDAAEIAKQFLGDDRSGGPVTRLYCRAGVSTRHSVVLESSTNGKIKVQSFYQPAQSVDDRGPTLGDRMRVYERSATAIGVRAARKAINDAEITPSDVTHLVTVSCTGFNAPGFDIELCKELNLPSGVARTHIGFMGCHAMLNALRVADAFANDPNAIVLVCAVELCSLHHQYGARADRIVSNSLFADGAAALVCRQRQSHFKTRPVLASSASMILPDTMDQMTWKLRDHGFEMTLSTLVPGIIRQRLGEWLADWLQSQSMSIADVSRWAVHPGGPRILDAVDAALQLPSDALSESREILQHYGNMSSPTIAFVLERLGIIQAPAPCVVLGFGPGLTIEAALLR